MDPRLCGRGAVPVNKVNRIIVNEAADGAQRPPDRQNGGAHQARYGGAQSPPLQPVFPRNSGELDTETAFSAQPMQPPVNAAVNPIGQDPPPYPDPAFVRQNPIPGVTPSFGQPQMKKKRPPDIRKITLFLSISSFVTALLCINFGFFYLIPCMTTGLLTIIAAIWFRGINERTAASMIAASIITMVLCLIPFIFSMDTESWIIPICILYLVFAVSFMLIYRTDKPSVWFSAMLLHTAVSMILGFIVSISWSLPAVVISLICFVYPLIMLIRFFRLQKNKQ